MILLLVINAVLSVFFMTMMSIIGDKGDIERLGFDNFIKAFTQKRWVQIAYYVAVVLLELFYCMLICLFVAVYREIMRMLKEYASDLYDNTQCFLVIGVVAYILIMGFRAVIYFLLRFNPFRSQRFLEVLFYTSEVVIVALTIYILWATIDIEGKEENKEAGSIAD